MDLRQAVLLVGGRGTRMWPLTATVPKGLLPVAGVPFVDLQVRQLNGVGIDTVFLAVGRHQLEQWEEYAAQRSGIELIVEDAPLDTAGPVRAALDRLDERFMVLNGDVVMETDLSDYLGSVEDGPAATLALVEVEDTSAYGVVVVDDGMVAAFVEKPPTEQAPARTVNAGMYVMTREAVSHHPVGPLSFERIVFPDLAEEGRLGAVTIAGTWLDIGTPELFLDCTGEVLGGATSLHRPEGPHLVEGSVDGEVEGSWSWVAPGATVAPGARIAQSVILPGASVGSEAVVADSVIGWDAVIAPGAQIAGHTMVGAGATVGSGCELGRGMRVAPGTNLAPDSVRFTAPD